MFIAKAIRFRQRKRTFVTTPTRQSLTARRSSAASMGCLRTIFALFLIIGVGIFYLVTVRPFLQVVSASKWVQTPCVIDSSRVDVHPNSDRHGRATYSIEVAYHYTFQGSDFTSRHYQFDTGGSTTGFAAKQRVVSQYPPGRKTFCYVNPEAPAEAVIDRGAHAGMAIGAIFLIFSLIGGFGLWLAPRLARSQRTGLKNVMPVAAPATGEPIELKPQVTPLAKFLGMLVVGLVWNCFIGIFAYLIFFSADRQKVPLFAKIFVGCFVLIGVLILYGAIRRFLALFNPRLVLTTRTAAVPLGGEFRFQWNLQGRTGKLHKLRILLEGQELATYHGGKTMHIVTQVFAEIPVVETIDHDILAEGQAKVVIPAGLMHTFTGGYNRIVWRLRVRGEVPHWPALEEDYAINILPQAPAA